MKLIFSSTSPYARKVRVVLAEKKIECQQAELSPWTADNPVHAFSPLGKVPVLMLDDGTALFDSRVIVEYLDNVSPVSRLIPEPSRQRIAVRRWEALADGVNDAAVGIVMERRRPPAQQSDEWIARQEQKLGEGVAELARELGDKSWCNGEGYSLADIATGCALGYLDLRHPQLGWREAYPNLAHLHGRLAKRPSFADTAPPLA
ncbi:MAG: glutathione S-transferase N-terminal domain-containing protein [Casimicrobiaceae bacterium]